MKPSGGEASLTSDGLPTSSCSAVRMVLQRYRHAKIVIDESRVIALGNPVENLLAASSTKGSSSSETAGMLVYVSFGRTATKNNTEQAARTLLNLPILTLGAWGDGQGTQSILQLSADLFRKRNMSQASPSTNGKGLDDVSPLSLLLVPQANLTAKVKKLGKSIQYRDQVEKSQGEALYQYFCDAIEKLLIEHHKGVQRGGGLHVTNASAGGIDGTKVEPTTTLDPAISPSEMFRQDDTYGSFEEDNDKIFPVTYANGEPVTKSAMKKLQKIYKAHSARHTKYVESRKRQEIGNKGAIKESSVIPVGGDDVSGAVREEEQDYVSVLPHESTEQGPRPPIVDMSFIQLAAGSFGMRQGIEIQSDMGPFCHVVEID